MKKLMPAIYPDILTAPAYPRPGHLILNELRQRVALASGVDRSYIRLAAMLGLPKSTLSNWCTQTAHPAVQVMVGLLERLPEEERATFVRRACRVHPTLSHPALTHDPTAMDLLRGLLRKQTGLTILQGEPARLFLLHALGHGYSAEDPKHRPVTGLSFQSPQVFVPVEGMLHIRTGLPLEVQEATRPKGLAADCLRKHVARSARRGLVTRARTAKPNPDTGPDSPRRLCR